MTEIVMSADSLGFGVADAVERHLAGCPHHCSTLDQASRRARP